MQAATRLGYIWVIIMMLGCAGVQKTASPPAVLLSPERLLEDSLGGGHVGIYIADAATGAALIGWNAHKYFVPASNTKLLSLYAGLKYLPDTLAGLRYYDAGDTVYALPTGDPTLLAADFKTHPVALWLYNLKKPLVLSAANWKAERYGRGWTWSDYQASYQPERSPLPVYGNIMPVLYLAWTDHPVGNPDSMYQMWQVTMGPAGEGGLKLQPDSYTIMPAPHQRFRITRDYASNRFALQVPPAKDTMIRAEVPFVTQGMEVAVRVLRQLPYRLKDSLPIFIRKPQADPFPVDYSAFRVVLSQPRDSMLRPMMHRSDNLYAEQTLLMAADNLLGYMSDAAMIDTLLKTHLKDMPDKPVWADGSGLSRYNLQSPANFVWLLQKMQREFGMEKLKLILPTGNAGTLTNYYRSLSGRFFAKTGTLSGVVALSGCMYAQSGRLLNFSVLVNNHNTDAPQVRRQVERYLMKIWEVY